MEQFKRLMARGLLTLSALCLLSAPAAAQSVVVDGVGADERAALIDASRAAVEQVAGTFIDSRTLVENAAVKLDQIYTKAQGFVTGTEILAKEQQGGLVHLRARIDVDTDPDAQLMNNLSMIMMLNDPRIAVVVREAGAATTARQSRRSTISCSTSASHMSSPVSARRGLTSAVSAQLLRAQRPDSRSAPTTSCSAACSRRPWTSRCPTVRAAATARHSSSRAMHA